MTSALVLAVGVASATIIYPVAVSPVARPAVAVYVMPTPVGGILCFE